MHADRAGERTVLLGGKRVIEEVAQPGPASAKPSVVGRIGEDQVNRIAFEFRQTFLAIAEKHSVLHAEQGRTHPGEVEEQAPGCSAAGEFGE
jgi:hypothetical protein